MTTFFPDVHIGLEDESTSDQLKNLAYHEFAHTSHYNQVGDNFWLAEIKATVQADGWGGPNDFDAGRIAICESWAHHLGHTYADRTFGLDHSNPVPPPFTIASQRWINLLERDFLEGGEGEIPHIPGAIYHDLIDDNSMPIAGSQENGAVTSDGGVTGYTNAIIFSHLTAQTTTPIILRENLKTTLPPGITGPTIDALFLDYGY